MEASRLNTPRGFFITGTDTGVGKTLLSCALLHAFADRNHTCVGMKPVAAGCEYTPAGLRCEDVEALRIASNVEAPRELRNPFALRAPVAPHLAAEREQNPLHLAPMLDAYEKLQLRAEFVIVEGVGGWMVPFNATQTSADLAQQLKLPVILVVGMRLGCLNHALLTVQAIAASELSLAGWIANRIDPAMDLFEENVQTLRQRLEAPLLGVVMHQAHPDAHQVSRLLDISLLR